MRRAAWSWMLGAGVALGSAGCALFSKSAPITPRYFSPERPDDLPRTVARRAGVSSQLRLGRVASAANLGELLVFRDSASEVGYRRLERWTEAPEYYLRRRLARVLFEERGLHEALTGAVPTLDAELTAFEETLAPPRMARVQVVVKLHDLHRTSWQETVTEEQPVVLAAGIDESQAAVAAIGAALRAAVDRIADRVERELEPGATHE